MDLSKFKKIESIIKLQKLGFPTPNTVFIFDHEKQENEIDNFLRNRKLVMIRSDKSGHDGKCPHHLECPTEEAKDFIKNINSKGFAAILQDFVPFNNLFSGNVLVLKDKFVIEVVEGSHLTILNRHGKMDEHIEISRNDYKKIKHHGKKIVKKEVLEKILKFVNKDELVHKIVEFSIAPDWFYFWQIREDKTSHLLEE